MVGLPATLAALGGMGSAIPGVMKSFQDQQKAADEMAAEALIGQAFQGGLFQQQVPGATPMGGQQPTAQADTGTATDSSKGGTILPGGERFLDTPSTSPAPTTGPVAPVGAPGGPPTPPDPTKKGATKGPTPAPRAPEAAPGSPPGGPVGRLKFEDILQRLTQSPIAQKNPRALGQAVLKMLPFMNYETRLEAQQYLAQYRMQMAENAETRNAIAAQRLEQQGQNQEVRQQQAWERIHVSQARLAFDELKNDRAWLQAEQRIQNAKTHQDIMAGVTAARAILAAKIQAINAGATPEDQRSLKPYLDRLQQTMEQAIQDEARDRARKLPTAPAPTFEERFPSPATPGPAGSP